MEMCFVNMIDPGDKVIVCRNGVFGGRMIENVQRCGGTAVVVDDRWGTPVDPQKARRRAQGESGCQDRAFVHAETSTGVQSDAKTLAELARKHGAFTIVDAVTSSAARRY
jgi:alanine-glyoxylate transaminase/serine-glyoxylate transaminase/serine-pyruvate transaminase